MNITPQGIAAIRAYITDWTPSDATIASNLNAPSVANPTPQPTAPKLYSFADVMGCLGAASIANVRALPTATALVTAINARDTVSILNWLAALQAGTPLITPSEAAAVQAVITATQPDPAWAAQVSWAAVNLGRVADSDDVAAARAAQ